MSILYAHVNCDVTVGNTKDIITTNLYGVTMSNTDNVIITNGNDVLLHEAVHVNMLYSNVPVVSAKDILKNFYGDTICHNDVVAVTDNCHCYR